MSEDWLYIIPTDPTWLPDDATTERALAAVTGLVPADDPPDAIRSEGIAFVDCGANLLSVACPACSADLLEWWGDTMGERYDEAFDDLLATTPCCGQATSLNDLRYDWPQGFASWRIEVRDPDRGTLEPHELVVIADAVGHPVRQIWQHI